MAEDTNPPADGQVPVPTGDSAAQGGGQPAGGAKQYSLDDNQIIYDLSALHPLTSFDEKAFVDLLEHSLSLSVSEKKRVIDAIPTLSQYQIDELTKVFEDERIEFKKLMPKEGDTIKKLVVEKRDEWQKLKQIYMDELEAKKAENQSQDQIDDIKSSLGI